MQDGRRRTPGQESNATAKNFQFACELSIVQFVEVEVQMLFNFKPTDSADQQRESNMSNVDSGESFS